MMKIDFDKRLTKGRWRKSIRERFEEKFERLEEADCWLWKGATGGRGYGAFSLEGRSHAASRVSWMLYRGEIPEGLDACHTCDTPLCVNPNHLFLGTDKDNHDDCVKKGRDIAGEKTYNAKLTESDVREIRSSTATIRSVAVQKGICPAQAWRIKHGERWKHVVGV